MIKRLLLMCECEGCRNRATKILAIKNKTTGRTKNIWVCEDCSWEFDYESKGVRA